MEKDLTISQLNLVNFKNYPEAEINFSKKINCFVGTNGAGKTNILDAIYYLGMCKSYLNPIDRQNIRFSSSFFIIQSCWNKADEEETIYCGVKEGRKKVFKKNKVEYERLADHIGKFPVVMISPYDRNMILEGSAIRRKWMDSIISQFNHHFLNDLIRYKKILKQRNTTLKNSAKNGFFDPEVLEIWDEQLIEYGNRIHKERKAMVEEFIPIFQHYYEWISNSEEKVGLRYQSQLLENPFSDLLHHSKIKDRERQHTTVGTHRDDFIFTIKEMPIKKFGSQGQQKSYLIALRLAQYDWLKERLKCKPILLLDDIFDKLDNKRVERLMQIVNKGTFGQVMITDTDIQRVHTIFSSNSIPYQCFLVENNEVLNYSTEELTM